MRLRSSINILAATGLSCCTLALLWLTQTSVFAHPVTQGSINVRVLQEQLELVVRVSREEMTTAVMHKHGPLPDTLDEALKEYGAYLLAHLHVELDSTVAAGIVLKWEQAKGPADDRITYTLRYPYAAGKHPEKLRLAEDVLNEIEYAPGEPWEASYYVSVTRASGATELGLLLTRKQPLSIELNETSSNAEPAPVPSVHVSGWAFCQHGIMHILTGYDHLLFIATLVLAAASFWELFKVVAAFTVAHSLTLTLSVLHIVRLSDRIVEPFIAASIIYVALENIFYPKRSRSWTRLLVAFFFGLFHGLGFAGGLLEAMEGMPGVGVALALVAFSFGVELGHQVVIIPLYGIVSALRRAQKDETAREKLSDRIRKFSSAAIAVAGVFYFVAALSL